MLLPSSTSSTYYHCNLHFTFSGHCIGPDIRWTWSSFHLTFTICSFSPSLCPILHCVQFFFGVCLLFSLRLLRLSHADYPGPCRLPRVQKPLVVEFPPGWSLCTSAVLDWPCSVPFLLRYAGWVFNIVFNELKEWHYII